VRVALVTRPKPDRDNTLPLYIRIAHAGKDRYVALGLRVPADDWNPKRAEVRKTNAEHRRLNDLLGDRLRVATAAAEGAVVGGGRNVSPDRIKAAVEAAIHPEAEPEPEEAPGVVAIGRRVMEEKTAKGKHGTALVYGTAMNNLEATFLAAYGAPDLAVADVTADVVRLHERRLSAAPPKGLGHKPNYVNRQMRTLRTVLRRAEVDGVPGAEGAVRVISAMRFKTEKVEKPRLTREEVLKLEEARPGMRGRKRDVLDWWLFAFYAGGMRFGDVLALRWDQVERDGDGVPVYVRWRMRKTGDAQGVPLLPQPAAILREWEARTGPDGAKPSPFVFGMITEAVRDDAERLFRETHRWSAIARKHLRRIAEGTGTQYVGFHGSRHSLADHLRKSGVPVATISHVLGHSSIQVTMGYLAGFDRQGVEDALRGALG